MLDLGTVKPGSTFEIPFHSFDSNDPSASVVVSDFVVGDVAVYKDGGTTQRASTSGYTLLDTDGINFDGVVGCHGISLDISDNTTAGFWEAGSRYMVLIGPVTIDAATINFWAATFRVGYPDAILNTTIATLASQVSFTLEEGPADNDALNGCRVVVHDLASAVQIAQGVVSGYVGSTKTITLKADPGIFTMAAGDNVSFFVAALVPTTLGNTLDVNATGEAGLDLDNTSGTWAAAQFAAAFLTASKFGASAIDAVALATDAVQEIRDAITGGAYALDTDANGRIRIVDGVGVGEINTNAGAIALVDLCTSNSDMRGTDNAALAALVTAARMGALDDWIDGGRLDLILDIIAADTTTDIPALIAALENISEANVLTQVNAALDTNIAELGVGVPSATPTIRTGLMFLYMGVRNKRDTTSASDEIHNDAGVVIASAVLSDDTVTYISGEYA